MIDEVEAPGVPLPLFEANQAIPQYENAVEALWQGCTTLREHRGDVHVQALRALGVDGIEAHLLLAADHSIDQHVLLDNRGWIHADWERAIARLQNKLLLSASGALTKLGRTRRVEIESLTDAGAAQPWARLQRDDVLTVLEALTVAAEAVARSGTIPFPNPMGLPSLIETL